MILVSSTEFFSCITYNEKIKFYDSSKLTDSFSEIVQLLEKGENMLFAGCEGLNFLKELWIENVDGIKSYHETILKNSVLPKLRFRKSKSRYLYILPPDPYTQHCIHTEPRADIIPIVNAVGRYGNLLGVSGMLVKNYDTALASTAYKGGFWYLFSFENPLEAMPAYQWDKLIKDIIKKDEDKCYIKKVVPSFPMYFPDERVRIEAEIENISQDMVSTELCFELYDMQDNFVCNIGKAEACLNFNECQRVYLDYYPQNISGVYQIHASLYRFDRNSYGRKRISTKEILDESICGIYIKEENTVKPAVKIDKNNIEIDGETDFIIGTHFYPTNSFTDLSYRPFKIEKAYTEIVNIKENGVKLVRIWTDRILDETAFRSLESLLDMLSINGMAAIVTLYTSWYQFSEINMPDFKLTIQTEEMKDDTLIGLVLKNMDEQCEYVGYIAGRWKEYTNLIWDLTNEFSVCFPDKNPYESISLFKKWADEISSAIRRNGANQPIIRGTSCWDTGSENYLATKEADIIAYHSYHDKQLSGKAAVIQNSACIEKPFIIEEFGGVWRYEQTPENYDSRYHYFLASGAAAACNYEWGVSWLADRLPYTSPDLKYYHGNKIEDLKDRFIFGGRFMYADTWKEGSIGVCPWAASFEYGINYPCTLSPSPTKRLMSRISELGKNLPFIPQKKNAYLILPMEFTGFREYAGYGRKYDNIYHTLDLLWENGAEYNVCQEDSINLIPDDTGIVIYPNTDDIKPKIKKQLKSLENKGIKVFYGKDISYLNSNCLSKIQFKAKKGTRLLVRDIEYGKVLSLFSDNKKQTAVINDRIRLSMKEYATAITKNEKLIAAECFGSLSIDSKSIVETKSRYIIKALDGKELSETERLMVFSYESGIFKLDRKFKKAIVVDFLDNKIKEEQLINGELNIKADSIDFKYIVL